ncbi:hypothetical protein EHYA_00437 [Embleya hyalina]|uniref:Uncharacterized protein n=1 Tax=Embleya hyalina TaxID=516124 RepID=A0A401YDY2_9ACTN|nr:hypothetical protein EHYA_00437 [Embleya hyalina]
MVPSRVKEVPSSAWAMPKSMTWGPSSASSTLPGLRSRWITPAAWIPTSASDTPASNIRNDASGSGPCRRTASCSDRPETNAVAIHGGSPSGSASTTGAVKAPDTRRAAATSARKRPRKPSSAAKSARMTFTATARPAAERPR